MELDFLAGGEYRAEIVRDGINAASLGEDYILEETTFRTGDRLSVDMAPGGGFAVKLIKK
jgi:alpha-glucosidase